MTATNADENCLIHESYQHLFLSDWASDLINKLDINIENLLEQLGEDETTGDEAESRRQKLNEYRTHETERIRQELAKRRKFVEVNGAVINEKCVALFKKLVSDGVDEERALQGAHYEFQRLALDDRSVWFLEGHADKVGRLVCVDKFFTQDEIDRGEKEMREAAQENTTEDARDQEMREACQANANVMKDTGCGCFVRRTDPRCCPDHGDQCCCRISETFEDIIVPEEPLPTSRGLVLTGCYGRQDGLPWTADFSHCYWLAAVAKSTSHLPTNHVFLNVKDIPLDSCFCCLNSICEPFWDAKERFNKASMLKYLKQLGTHGTCELWDSICQKGISSVPAFREIQPQRLLGVHETDDTSFTWQLKEMSEKYGVVHLTGNQVEQMAKDKSEFLSMFLKARISSLCPPSRAPSLLAMFSNVKCLDLTKSGLAAWPTESLAQLTSLRSLSLSENPEAAAGEISAGFLSSLPAQLRILDLARCRIKRLASGCFVAPSSELVQLFLDENEIESVDAGVFELPKLLLLFLDKNNISNVCEDAFLACPALDKLAIFNNKLEVDTDRLYACCGMSSGDIAVSWLKENFAAHFALPTKLDLPLLGLKDLPRDLQFLKEAIPQLISHFKGPIADSFLAASLVRDLKKKLGPDFVRLTLFSRGFSSVPTRKVFFRQWRAQNTLSPRDIFLKNWASFFCEITRDYQDPILPQQPGELLKLGAELLPKIIQVILPALSQALMSERDFH